jgi:hypothetical protein
MSSRKITSVPHEIARFICRGTPQTASEVVPWFTEIDRRFPSITFKQFLRAAEIADEIFRETAERA